jgi:integrase
VRGHIVKRYKDSYTIVLNLGRDPATGKRKQQWVTVKGTKKDAEKKLAELLHQLDTGTLMKPGRTTLGEFLRRWLTEYVQTNLAPRTAEGYETIVERHLIPDMGRLALTQLRPEHITHYYTKKLITGRYDGKGALNPRTVRHHHMVLHKALECAVRWGLLSRNPVDAVIPPRAHKAEWNTLSEDDIQTVLNVAANTPYYALFYLALFTGMRRSELLALRWSDVDLLLCQVYVNRTLHHLRNGDIVFRPPKSVRSRRVIALPPSVVLVLKEHREKQKLDRHMLGVPLKDDDLVFCNYSGKPLLPGTVSHAWTKLVAKIGLNGVRLHDTRHSHASIMLKAGTHPKIVQERLGHASIQTTLDTYSHVAPGLQEAAAKRFDEVVTTKRRDEALKENG